MLSRELQALYEHCCRVENMADDRVVWAILEYKEKLEKRLPYYVHLQSREFKHISTCLWAIDEILGRVVGKSLKNALTEVEQFRELLEDYDGKNKVNRKNFAIAADVAQHVYEMLVEEFTL